MASQLECAFCNRTEDQAAMLIRTVANVCICNACVAMCVQLMADEMQRANEAAKADAASAVPKEG